MVAQLVQVDPSDSPPVRLSLIKENQGLRQRVQAAHSNPTYHSAGTTSAGGSGYVTMTTGEAKSGSSGFISIAVGRYPRVCRRATGNAALVLVLRVTQPELHRRG